jgi:hypothetical protein
MEDMNPGPEFLLTWVYPLAPLAAVIIGAFAVAYLTKVRDHAAWLRNKRLEAIVEFIQAAGDFVTRIRDPLDSEERSRALRKGYSTLLLLSPKPLNEAGLHLLVYLLGPDSQISNPSSVGIAVYIPRANDEIAKFRKVAQIYLSAKTDNAADIAAIRLRKKQALEDRAKKSNRVQSDNEQGR